MPLTTPERVKKTAKHLTKVDEEDINLAIEDAELDVERYRIKDEKKKERIVRYLACHYLTLNHRRPESHGASDVRVDFPQEGRADATGLDKTTYGQEAKRMIKEATGLKLVVL